MVALQERLRAFETKHRFDEETYYQINAKAAQKLGRWVARHHMRYTEDQVENFIHNEVFLHLARRGMPFVMEFLVAKLKESDSRVSDYVLLRQRDRFIKEARIEVMQLRHNPMARRRRKN